MQNNKLIANVKKNQNLFVLDFVMPGKIMQVHGILNVLTTNG